MTDTDWKSQNTYRDERNRCADMYYNLVPQFKPPSKFYIMKDKLRYYIKDKLHNKYLRWIGILQILFIALLIVSIFVIIWGPWSFAWRLSVTGLVGIFLCYGIGKIADEVLNTAVDKFMTNEVNEKGTDLNTNSTFQEKLMKLQQEREQLKKGKA